MPSRAPLCAWVAVCALGLPTPLVAQSMRATEVVDLIVREGPRAAAIRAEVDVVRREQAARRRWPNPALSYSREGAGFTEFLQIDQSVPAFGLRGALLRAGASAIAAAEAERDAGLWDLRAEATRAVVGVVAAEARRQAATSAVERLAELVAVLRVREQLGESSRLDRVRAELELADARQDATAARIDVVSARAAVAALLPAGFDVPPLIDDLFAERPAPSSATLLASALAQRAELRALVQLGTRFEHEEVAARRARGPQISLTAGLKRAESDASRSLTGGIFGAGIAVPLFDTGSRDEARWAAESARVAAERRAVEQVVRSEVLAAIATLDLRQQAVMLTPRPEVADELVEMADVAYREGEASIATLLDAVRTAARVRQRYVEAQLEARRAQVALERAVGGVLWP